jgi:hypothetical protein
VLPPHIGQHPECSYGIGDFGLNCFHKQEIRMRTIIALALTFAASGALADELGDARKLALQGRDSYWNCLAREYQNDGTRNMSARDFTADIASICPSERQNFRVTLMDYLSMQFPDAEPSANLTTANRAIELAQKDIVTAFVHRKGTN